MNNEPNEALDENVIDAQSVEAILSTSLKELEEHNKAAYELLIKQAREGFFVEHQTPKEIKKLANELLESLSDSEAENED